MIELDVGIDLVEGSVIGTPSGEVKGVRINVMNEDNDDEDQIQVEHDEDNDEVRIIVNQECVWSKVYES
jgi:hypothetical protein